MLTDKQKDNYVNGGNNKCPHCKSIDLSSYPYEADDNWVSYHVVCERCGKSWAEIYTLTNIVSVEEEEES